MQQCMHPTVNIKHIKVAPRTPRGITRPPPIAANDIYELEANTGHKKTRRGVLYHCKWKGYPSTDQSWEPPASFLGEDAQRILRDYQRSHV